MRKKSKKLVTEIVFFYLYDAGRSIDLLKVPHLIPANPEKNEFRNKRDTPESLTLPVPLTVELVRLSLEEAKPFDGVSLDARIFAEGVISMIVRIVGRFEPEALGSVRQTPFCVNGTMTTADELADAALKDLFARIQEAITFEQYVFSTFVRETYTAFCINESIENPALFIRENRSTFACLLNGEAAETRLHENQIASTLSNVFTYTERDYALFDLNHCLIINPARDYEDILLVIEQANFQLLELRALDMLLDRWLDKAEDDIQIVFRKNVAQLKTLKAKLANIQVLALDALFILENLENSSKIIGDYFLGQIYGSLCGHFNTEGWKRSIDRRLKTLSSVYDRVSANDSERRMIFLEVMFIVVCVIFPLLQILQVFLVS